MKLLCRKNLRFGKNKTTFDKFKKAAGFSQYKENPTAHIIYR